MKNLIEITLTNSESTQLRSAYKDCEYDALGNTEYISGIRATAYRVFPNRILRMLEEQKSSSNPASAIIFSNIPIDEEIYGSPNFSQTGKNFKSGTLSENVLCAIGAIVGEPYSVHFEGNELVNNLTPQHETKTDYTGLGSGVELDFHIENAALNYLTEDDCSPMSLLLLGIRYDETGPKTRIADAREALNLLSDSDIDALYENNFIIRLPYRWRSAFENNRENTELCSMLSGPLHLPRVSTVFYPDMVLPVNSKSKKAFMNLHDAIKRISIEINITPGKLVLIDNRFTLHSRDKFSAKYDGNGMPYRWIQRLFITKNLWAFRGFQKIGERVFNPVYLHSTLE